MQTLRGNEYRVGKMDPDGGVLDQVRARGWQYWNDGRVWVCNPHVFHLGQKVQVWEALTGKYRGSFHVERIGSGNSRWIDSRWIEGPLPEGTRAGDYLLIVPNGSK